MQYVLSNQLRRMLFGFLSAALFAAFFVSPASAATVTFVSGTVTLPGGAGASGVLVELHNGNGSVSFNATTNASGAYSISGDNAAAIGQQLSVEIGPSAILPTGYIRPTTGSSFTYTDGLATQTANFELIGASKTINVSVVDENGAPVANADIQALPVNANGTLSSSGTVTNGTGTLNVSGGKWVVKADRNLSEQNPTRYPWVNIDPAQEVSFAENTTTESATVTFHVVNSSSLVTIKPVDKNGAILNLNSFNGDVSFVGLTKYGPVSTQAKVSGTTGVASLYLLPGIYTVEAYHPQLEGQSFDPKENTFVVEEGAGTIDWGTLTAKANTATLKGKVTMVNITSKDVEEKSSDTLTNLPVKATNIHNGRTYTGNTTTGGAFTIANVAGGEYSIDLDTTSGTHLALHSAAATVDYAKTIDDLEITATRKDYSITGTVRDSNGAAIQNLAASVLVQSGNDEFSSPVAADGTYTIKAYKNGDSSLTMQLITQKGARYYAADTTLSLTSASTITQDITALSDEGTITGSIVNDASGTALSDAILGDGATVTAIHKTTGSVEETTVAADGSYALSVGPGKWQVVPKINDLTATAFVGGVSSDTATVTAGTATTGVQLSAHVVTGGSVTGVVKDKAGVVVPEARVTITNLPALEDAADAAKTNINMEDVVTITTKTAANGSFSQALPDGKYTAYFSDQPELTDQVVPGSQTFTVAGATKTLPDAQFTDADNAVKGTLDKDLTQANVVFYSETGKAVEATVNGSQYTVDISDGNWTAIVSGVDQNGELAMVQRDVKITKKSSVNFPDVSSTGIEFPAAAQTTCNASSVCALSNSEGAKIQLAPYAADTAGTITAQIAPIPEIVYSNGLAQVGIAYEMSVWNSDGIEVSQLARPADITLPIDKELIDAGVSTTELTPSFYQPETGQFMAEGLASYASKTEMTLQTDHLTRFAMTSVRDKAKPVKSKALASRKIKKNQSQLTWDAPLGSSVKTYTVSVREKGKSKVTKYKKITGLNKTVKKLKAGTQYQFRVQACNTIGCGKYSAWKTFKTKK